MVNAGYDRATIFKPDMFALASEAHKDRTLITSLCSVSNPTRIAHVFNCQMSGGAAPPEKSNTKGLILHDPALGMGYNMIRPNGAKSQIPAISYISDEYDRANVRCVDLTLHVRGCFHGNFVDAPLWVPVAVMRPLTLAIPALGPADPFVVHDQLAESAMAILEGGWG